MTVLHGNVLDGNVLAGPLAEVYGVDVSSLTIRCTDCGDGAVLAQTVVHVAAGLVVRCRSCDGVLLTVVLRPGASPVVTATAVSGLPG